MAAASLLYFDKSVHELNIAEAAYLAALPKAPNNYNPFRQRERAVERRNWVIDQMVVTGAIKQADADKAKKEPLTVTPRPTGAHIFAAEYFAEEVRRWIYEKYVQTLRAVARHMRSLDIPVVGRPLLGEKVGRAHAGYVFARTYLSGKTDWASL